jgi:membrane protease YdiL (CAAX protease family)
MRQLSSTADQGPISFGSLFPFLLITFGLAWGLFGLFVLLPGPIEHLFGELRASNPLFILAVYSPAIAAFAIVLRRTGIAGLGRFLSRLLLWRCSPGWYGFLLLGIPAIYIAGAALGGTLSAETFAWPDLGAVLAASAFMLVLGPVEEFGWRGLALPLLQRRMAPFWAGLILGLIWGIWHLPAFYLSGTPQSGWDFTPFFVGSVAVSLILTPLFNASRGSILLAMLFHFQLNNPMWPDAQPYDMYLFAAFAEVVVWLNRKNMFSRGDAVIEVVPRIHRSRSPAPARLRIDDIGAPHRPGT